MTDTVRDSKSTSPEKAFRPTAQRLLVLDVVTNADRHLTAAEIFERVRQHDPRIGYGTVYRSLHLLVEHGLIQELTFADQASRYDGRTERHDHVHCTICGVIVRCRSAVALMARHVAEERSGFAITAITPCFRGNVRPAGRRIPDRSNS